MRDEDYLTEEELDIIDKEEQELLDNYKTDFKEQEDEEWCNKQV